jgi:gas vesicle structural protein
MAADELVVWEPGDADDPHTLVDLINRVLDRGVVVTGEITISVAGVDLVHLGLNAVLTSVSTARERLARRPAPTSGAR